MSTDPGDFRMSPEPFNTAPEPPKPGRGCLFYGCITAAVVGVLFLVAVGVSGYFGYQAYLKIVNQYTSPTPVTLPKVEMSKEDRTALLARIDAFKDALEKDQETEPLVLSGDELNVWLAEKGGEDAERVFFVLEGDKLNGQVSLPLDELPFPGVKGRYLNGKGTFLASLRNGELDVRVDSIEVNGKPLPAPLQASLTNTNLAKDATKDPENARQLNKLESLEIKDGKLIIKAKPVKERGEAATKEEEPAQEPPAKPDEEAKPSETPKDDKPSEEAKPSEAPKDGKPGDEPKPSETPKDGKPADEKPLERAAPAPANKVEQ